MPPANPLQKDFPLRPLGNSSLLVTPVCLGTMTWGLQNTAAEAAAQLDYAVKQRGINFIDTAELYPVPSSDPRWAAGITEEYIGAWLEQNQDLRKDLVIATKVAGFIPESDVPRMRAADPAATETEKKPCRHDRESIIAACNASLRRLKTDYIDLYQLHWPDRYAPIFGSTAYDPKSEREGSIPFDDILRTLKELLDSGKIKAYGLSNETTFGVCQFVRGADALGMPRPVSIQNSFSLMHRSFETELAEACAPKNFNIGLLPWSVLAGGTLSGKYLGGKKPEGARHVLYPNFMPRFHADNVMEIVGKYAEIAKEAGMSLTTLAIAFCRSRWYVDGNGSCIIGATTMDQLTECIDAYKVELSEEVLAKIDAVHLSCRNPTQGL